MLEIHIIGQPHFKVRRKRRPPRHVPSVPKNPGRPPWDIPPVPKKPERPPWDIPPVIYYDESPSTPDFTFNSLAQAKTELARLDLLPHLQARAVSKETAAARSAYRAWLRDRSR